MGVCFSHNFQQLRYGDVILLSLYIPIIVVALAGNLLVIVTIAVQVSELLTFVLLYDVLQSLLTDTSIILSCE